MTEPPSPQVDSLLLLLSVSSFTHSPLSTFSTLLCVSSTPLNLALQLCVCVAVERGNQAVSSSLWEISSLLHCSPLRLTSLLILTAGIVQLPCWNPARLGYTETQHTFSSLNTFTVFSLMSGRDNPCSESRPIL